MIETFLLALLILGGHFRISTGTHRDLKKSLLVTANKKHGTAPPIANQLIAA